MKKYFKIRILGLILAAAALICSSCSPQKSTNVSSETVSIELSSQQSSVVARPEVSSDILSVESSKPQTSSKPQETLSSAISVNVNGLDNTKIGWGPGVIKEHKRSVYAESNNAKYGEYGALFIGDDTKNIYLTFDEGYENGYTAPILDTLKEKGVKAVFFVTYDYVKRNEALVKRMIDEGHVVGNHSWSHPSMPSVSEERAAEEITKLHDLVLEKFNYEMKYFRFPMGEFSAKTLEICKQCGYKSVFWSFAYADWDTKNQPDEQKALEKVIESSHNGAIYLLHAVSKTNTNILPKVIDDVRAQGYTWAEFDL